MLTITDCDCGILGAAKCAAATLTDDDRQVVWVSHAPSDVHVECRMDENNDMQADDQREGASGTVTGKRACDGCVSRLSGQPA